MKEVSELNSMLGNLLKTLLKMVVYLPHLTLLITPCLIGDFLYRLFGSKSTLSINILCTLVPKILRNELKEKLWASPVMFPPCKETLVKHYFSK